MFLIALLPGILTGNLMGTRKAWFFIAWNLKSREDKTRKKNYKLRQYQDSRGGPGTMTLCSNAGGPGSFPWEGTRSHMLQLRPGTAK